MDMPHLGLGTSIQADNSSFQEKSPGLLQTECEKRHKCQLHFMSRQFSLLLWPSCSLPSDNPAPGWAH